MQAYPKMIYHETLAPKIVKSKEEHENWGEDWKESPADFIKEGKPSVELEKLSDADLKALALEKGVSKKKLKDLSNEEIIKLLSGDECKSET